MATTDISMDSLEETVLAINKMLLTKRRLLTEDFLREIIVLSNIYGQEEVIKNGLDNAIEQDRDIDDAVEIFGLLEIINYTPVPINDLLVDLQKNDNSESEFIDVTPDWIKKVLMLYDEVFKNYQLSLIADKFSD